jgi:hypothetical protein
LANNLRELPSLRQPLTDLFSRLLWFCCLAALGPSAAFSSAVVLPCDSLADYRASLKIIDKDLSNRKNAFDELAASIPATCDFGIGAKRMHVSNADLRARLQSMEEETEPPKVLAESEALHAAVLRRLANLDEYDRVADSTAKSKLQNILAGSEFRNVQSDDPSNKLKEKLMEWVMLLLSKLIRDPGQVRWLASAVVWCVCGLIAIILILWIWRWLKGRPVYRGVAEREFILFAPSAKGWRQWLAEAKEAMRAGNFREAMHLAYWAAIAKLESAGTFRRDRARTPREYLSMLPRTSVIRPPLMEITRQFEIVWYGRQTPSAADCEEFVAKVERLA